MGIYKLTHLTLYRCGTKHTKPESWQTQPRFKRDYQIIDLKRERDRERDREREGEGGGGCSPL